MDVNHETKPIGRFLALMASSDGLRCISEVFDEPAGDLALHACQLGYVQGFSAYVGIKRSIDLGMRDGVRRIRILEAELRAGSLCTDPADPRAVIELVCGGEPQWQAAVHRMEVMHNLRPPPPLDG